MCQHVTFDNEDFFSILFHICGSNITDISTAFDVDRKCCMCIRTSSFGDVAWLTDTGKKQHVSRKTAPFLPPAWPACNYCTLRFCRSLLTSGGRFEMRPATSISALTTVDSDDGDDVCSKKRAVLHARCFCERRNCNRKRRSLREDLFFSFSCVLFSSLSLSLPSPLSSPPFLSSYLSRSARSLYKLS